MERIKTWWRQPCGAKELLAISLPLIASTISWTLMQFCDRLFLTWHSNDALAAVLPAAALSWTLTSLPMGVGFYCSTFVAQYFGADQKEKIGAIVWQSIWLGLLCVPVYLLIGLGGERIFSAIGHSPELCLLEHHYFLALAFGAGAVVLDAGISSFFVGQGKTGTVMYVNFFSAALNLALDYWFIFGGFGLPEMGLWGAGLATSISMWSKVLIFAWLFFLPHNAELGTRSQWRLDLSLMRRYFRYGLPNGLQFLIEGLAITFFFVVIPVISESASAAASVVFSINMLVIYPVFGLGMGCSTLVGQKIGEQQPDLASRATWNALTLGLIYTAVFAAAYFVAPNLFLFAHETEGGEFFKIKELVILYLKFVAVYCIFDTIQIVFVSAIKGAGDTRFVVIVTIITALFFVIGGSLGATQFSEPIAKVNWWWISLTGWLVMLSIAYGLRFRQGKWKSMSVIERGPDGSP
jgi:MATE family multidrug resistance protein